MPSDPTREGFCIWLTGLPGAGKTSAAYALAAELDSRGFPVQVLDGDQVRNVCGDCGHDLEGRTTQVARVAWMASKFVQSGVVAIAALVSPDEIPRKLAEESISQHGKFYLVQLKCPLDIRRSRKTKFYEHVEKGNYHLPYENPKATLATPDSSLKDPAMIAAEIVQLIASERGWE